MQRYFNNRWLRDRDLASSPLGRDDSPALVEKCWHYLTERSTGEHPIPLTTGAARKTKAELATAHVRASVRRAPELKDVLQRLADAEATIDRLLAFVPARAKELSSQRLAEVEQQLVNELARVFHGRGTEVSIESESDAESMACHRITVAVDITQHDDPLAFANSVTAVHQWLAESVQPQEFQALRLLVEPKMVPA